MLPYMAAKNISTDVLVLFLFILNVTNVNSRPREVLEGNLMLSFLIKGFWVSCEGRIIPNYTN